MTDTYKLTVKLGSLFDGSGGFPLAAAMCGITPVWASEVEPYPIAVTRERFPNMKHLGDISKINGAEIEPVDIISFGSPCQDLSVAGKRAGLKHEANGDEETTRSGLFMEAVRIIKEMRSATNGEYPRFALWENVPGAFSSNSGEDFRIVLEELIKVVEPSAIMPPVPRFGWPYADSYIGDGWSLAYRVFDAQHWGVPQRRRRIHLVADFRGECARKVLFERDGVRGYFTQSGKEGQGTAADAEGCATADDREGKGSIGINGEIAGTLDASYYKGCGMRQGIEREVIVQPVVHGFDAYNQALTGDKSMTMTAKSSDAHHVPCAVIKEQYLFENHSQDTRYKGPLPVSPMLPAQLGTGGNNTPFVVEEEKAPTYCLQGSMIGRADKNGPQGDGVNEDVAFTCNTIDRHAVAYQEKVSALCARDCKGVGSQYVDENKLVIAPTAHYIVRRLTPTECARLQGFADWWGHIEPKDDFTDEEYRFWLEVRNTHAAINDKPTKNYTKAQMLAWYNKLYNDSAEYKLWGNGIALPPALYVLQGMAGEFAGDVCLIL